MPRARTSRRQVVRKVHVHGERDCAPHRVGRRPHVPQRHLRARRGGERSEGRERGRARQNARAHSGSRRHAGGSPQAASPQLAAASASRRLTASHSQSAAVGGGSGDTPGALETSMCGAVILKKAPSRPPANGPNEGMGPWERVEADGGIAACESVVCDVYESADVRMERRPSAAAQKFLRQNAPAGAPRSFGWQHAARACRADRNRPAATAQADARRVLSPRSLYPTAFHHSKARV